MLPRALVEEGDLPLSIAAASRTDVEHIHSSTAHKRHTLGALRRIRLVVLVHQLEAGVDVAHSPGIASCGVGWELHMHRLARGERDGLDFVGIAARGERHGLVCGRGRDDDGDEDGKRSDLLGGGVCVCVYVCGNTSKQEFIKDNHPFGEGVEKKECSSQ